jgi:telomerase reverse transcriptase
MAGKRKRERPGQGTERRQKRQRVAGAFNGPRGNPPVRDALLAQYYPHVCSLREYLLSKLPPTSKIRRRKILSVGRNLARQTGECDQALSDALDRTLIGVSKHSVVSPHERWLEWASFSQRMDTSVSTFANITGAEALSQSEVGGYIFALLQP